MKTCELKTTAGKGASYVRSYKGEKRKRTPYLRARPFRFPFLPPMRIPCACCLFAFVSPRRAAARKVDALSDDQQNIPERSGAGSGGAREKECRCGQGRRWLAVSHQRTPLSGAGTFLGRRGGKNESRTQSGMRPIRFRRSSIFIGNYASAGSSCCSCRSRRKPRSIRTNWDSRRRGRSKRFRSLPAGILSGTARARDRRARSQRGLCPEP